MIETKIRGLFHKYYPEYENVVSKDFIHELGVEVNQLIAKAVKQQTSGGAYLSVKELEDLLLLVRDLKSKYETLENSTVSDVIKIDELKQTEYKLTEHILNNR